MGVGIGTEVLHFRHVVDIAINLDEEGAASGAPTTKELRSDEVEI